MLDTLLSFIAPHPCSYCGDLGAVLCSSCKYNITYDSGDECIVCGGVCGIRGVCQNCKVVYTSAWHIGERSSQLQKLLNDYKFEGVREAHRPLAELLSSKIGLLPSSVIVIPIPTVASHIRQRGYDHAYLLAKRLATLQKVSFKPLLLRNSRTQQRGASKSLRRKQAKTAFKVKSSLNGGVYLLVDDIITTGATLDFAAKTLLEAGADEVWVAVIARQPLDALEVAM